MKRMILAAVSALLVVLPSWQTVRADAPLYSVQDLGTLNGLVPTISGVNASGQVAGNVNNGQAVRYTSGLGWVALPGLGTTFSFATGINASGDVVGYYFNASANAYRAFRFRDGVGVQEIQPLPGDVWTLGLGIDDAGNVVGASMLNGFNRPFFADAVGLVPTLLPSTGSTGLACGINAAGQVVGTTNVASGAQHGMRIDPGVTLPLDLVSIDGDLFTVTSCAIDGAGRVGGQMDRVGGLTHAFRFTNADGMRDLDTFNNSVVSNIESIAAGVSAGWYSLDGVTMRAFAHRDADGSFDLNTRIDATSGWVLAKAKGINENGVIAGEGTLNGNSAVFLLTPQQTDKTPPVISSVTASPASISPSNGLPAPVTLAVNATDDSGQPPTCSISSLVGPGTLGTDFKVTGPLTGSVLAVAGRTYTFTVTCADAANNVSLPASVNVVVLDTIPPAIASVTATPNLLSPPDRRFVPVVVSVSVTDNLDPNPQCTLMSVGGVVSDDVSMMNGLSVSLRAAGGRLYTLNVRCTDASGNFSDGSTTVYVPPDLTPPTITSLSAMPNNLWPPDGRYAPVTVSVSATDNVDPNPVCALLNITGFTGPAGDAVVTGQFTATLHAVGGRTYSLNVRCADYSGNFVVRSVSVVVPPDITPPVITALSANPSSIWPPNNKMVAVMIYVSATDDVDPSPACSMTSVTGGPASDIVVTGPFSASVRATKNADGSVRTYMFNVSCWDSAGNTSMAAVTVSVSKDVQSQVIHYNRRH